MATRRIKFIGKAYGADGTVTMQIRMNGNEVFNGNVLAETTLEKTSYDPYEVCEFNLDASVTGWIPMEIAVTHGDIFFINLQGNYTGYSLTGFNNETNDTSQMVFEVSPEDYFGELNNNTLETDGKRHAIWESGTLPPYNRDDVSEQILTENNWLGEWSYFIPENDKLTFEFYIDPDIDCSTVTLEQAITKMKEMYNQGT